MQKTHILTLSHTHMDSAFIWICHQKGDKFEVYKCCSPTLTVQAGASELGCFGFTHCWQQEQHWWELWIWYRNIKETALANHCQSSSGGRFVIIVIESHNFLSDPSSWSYKARFVHVAVPSDLAQSYKYFLADTTILTWSWFGIWAHIWPCWHH